MPPIGRQRTRDWLIPAALLALGFIPMVVSVVRISQLAAGSVAAPDNARFFAAPWPVALHLVCSVVYCVLGAFQFSPGIRQRNRQWHRLSGRIVVTCGLVAALSALWMTQFLPAGSESPARFDGTVVYATRLLTGSAMALFLCLGVAAVVTRNVALHRAWMMRAYALGLGAGTQVFTHLPWFLFPGIQGEAARALCMGAGWAINLALAEWLIARKPLAQVVEQGIDADPGRLQRRR